MQTLLKNAAFHMSVRKRKRKTYLLDPLVQENIAILAKREKRSENQFVEMLLFEACKKAGLIDDDVEPLGETRGGKREAR